jgi:sugar (pentulose or hexulose) kinase
MTEYRMVYDSGSKLVKCAIADEVGQIVAMQSWDPDVIESEDGFQREWDYRTYWDNIVALTKTTIESASISSQDIKYISSSSIRPSCVFADEENNAVYIGASFELRGIDYADELEDEFSEMTGKSIYESCGHFPSLLLPPARYKYFQEEIEEDDRITRITQYLPQDSWMLVKLGGEVHANIVSAGESGFFDLEMKLWHPAWEHILDLPKYFFPWPVLPGEIIGTVSKHYQEELGLGADTKLVAGLPDTQAALLGAGCVEHGNIGAILGTTTPVQMVSDQLLMSPTEETWSGLMAIKHIYDGYFIEANTGLTGQLLKWAAKLFFSHETSELTEQFEQLDDAYKRYDQYEQEVSSEEIRMDSVYSFLGPSPLASTQMGITPGLFHFQSPGGVQEITTPRDSFITAIFDNIQFAISRNIDILKEKMPSTEHSISIMGGVTRNPVILQRFADLHNTTVTSSTRFETTIQGLLALCDVAAENVQSIEDLKTRYREQHLFRKFKPRTSMTKTLTTKYRTWQRLFKQYRD